MTADTPAASKDAPTDEAVMVNIAGNAQDLERAKEHARLLLKRVAAGPVGDGLSHAEYALLCLYAHVATLTAQLEAERATGDETARHISRLLDHLARETARADKAVAEAKALREELDWRPIETAPKDGTPILAWCVHPHARYVGDPKEWSCTVVTRWINHNGGGWTWNGMAGRFTHWRPVGDGPEARATLAQPADGGK